MLPAVIDADVKFGRPLTSCYANIDTILLTSSLFRTAAYIVSLATFSSTIMKKDLTAISFCKLVSYSTSFSGN